MDKVKIDFQITMDKGDDDFFSVNLSFDDRIIATQIVKRCDYLLAGTIIATLNRILLEESMRLFEVEKKILSTEVEDAIKIVGPVAAMCGISENDTKIIIDFVDKLRKCGLSGAEAGLNLRNSLKNKQKLWSKNLDIKTTKQPPHADIMKPNRYWRGLDEDGNMTWEPVIYYDEYNSNYFVHDKWRPKEHFSGRSFSDGFPPEAE